MKTTLAILITGLVLLTTPMLAQAYGNDHQNRSGQNNYSWSHDRQGDHHSRGHHSARHRDHRVARVDHHLYQAARPVIRPVRRVYARTPLILTTPRIVLHFGW